MHKVIVLGSGMVGSAIAIDLSRTHNVTVIDANGENLGKVGSRQGVQIIQGDVTHRKWLSGVVKDADLVVSAVPGSIGFATLQEVIKNRKNVVDIAFFPEDAFELDKLAREMEVTAIVDCGVAPGMSNLLLGYHSHQMTVDSFECLVGGLPRKRTLPYEYKAPFSPADVIEEYLRPARFIENGKFVIKPALSDPELVEFAEIGTLESFNTDGLRSLLKTMKVPNMREKTLRYPGHIDIIRVLLETGFFDKDTIDVQGQKVVPLALTSRLLFKLWELKPGEEELTVMRIRINGLEEDKPKTYIYDLLDRYDVATGTSSMARTTGYTCSAVVNLLLENHYSRIGISPPEYLGEEPSNVDFILEYLKARNVIYKRTVENE